MGRVEPVSKGKRKDTVKVYAVIEEPREVLVKREREELDQRE